MTDYDKARAGYDRALPHMRLIQIPWDDLPASVIPEYVAKVARVEADPEHWLSSDDPQCVAFAQGVLSAILVRVQAPEVLDANPIEQQARALIDGISLGTARGADLEWLAKLSGLPEDDIARHRAKRIADDRWPRKEAEAVEEPLPDALTIRGAMR